MAHFTVDRVNRINTITLSTSLSTVASVTARGTGKHRIQATIRTKQISTMRVPEIAYTVTINNVQQHGFLFAGHQSTTSSTSEGITINWFYDLNYGDVVAIKATSAVNSAVTMYCDLNIFCDHNFVNKEFSHGSIYLALTNILTSTPTTVGSIQVAQAGKYKVSYYTSYNIYTPAGIVVSNILGTNYTTKMTRYIHTSSINNYTISGVSDIVMNLSANQTLTFQMYLEGGGWAEVYAKNILVSWERIE